MKEMYSADKAFTTCTVGFVTGSIQLERMEFLPLVAPVPPTKMQCSVMKQYQLVTAQHTTIQVQLD